MKRPKGNPRSDDDWPDEAVPFIGTVCQLTESAKPVRVPKKRPIGFLPIKTPKRSKKS